MADRKCLMQNGMMMPEAWCIKAQYREWCAGCKYDLGKEESDWQIKQKEERPPEGPGSYVTTQDDESYQP